jgi:hypothetical protein
VDGIWNREYAVIFYSEVPLLHCDNFGPKWTSRSGTLHLTDFIRPTSHVQVEFAAGINCRGGSIFVSKTATVVVALVIIMLIPTASKAQLIQSGNVYAGVAYSSSVDVINRGSYRGWDGGVEVKPFIRTPYLGFILDFSGIYRSGVQQYNAILGARVSKNYGKWRVFAHAGGGIAQLTTFNEAFNPILEDGGGGVDRRLPFKRFAWRLQGDYVHSHLLHANQNDFRVSTGLVWRF